MRMKKWQKIAINRLEDWSSRLGLDKTYRFKVFFLDELVTGGDSVAEILTEPPYKSAFVNFLNSFGENADEADIERAALHELLHLIVNPIKTIVHPHIGPDVCDRTTEVTEGVVDTLTSIILAQSNRSKYHKQFEVVNGNLRSKTQAS